MEPAVLGEGHRIVIIPNQFFHHFDAGRASFLRYIFVEAQKSIPARRRVTSGFPRMNDADQSILIWVTTVIEPIVISFYLPVNAVKKFAVLAVLKYEVGGNCDQRRMCDRATLWLAPQPAAFIAPVVAVGDHAGIRACLHLTRYQTQQLHLRLLRI